MLDVAPEVAAALREGAAVVALESTIITHGMPYPQNAETARAVEAEVRAAGAVPATIAVIAGRCRIGLETEALDRLAAARAVQKASRRDLGVAVAQGLTAGTTVAATMYLAARAGIRLFATGGIGGVHRGGEASLDISADLLELARSPVTVVCAGCKSSLDIGRTLEVLETQSVPVIGYGSDEFPAFYARSSGHRIEHRSDTPAALAAIIAARHSLGETGGLLIANPIAPEYALAHGEIDAAIDAALRQAETEGVSGKAVTPFLLSRVLDLTGGRSLTANIALVRGNARLAAQVAVALAKTG